MLLVLAIVAVALPWTVTLAYRGYRHASGLVGSALVGSFVGALVLGEIVSKLLLAAFAA